MQVKQHLTWSLPSRRLARCEKQEKGNKEKQREQKRGWIQNPRNGNQEKEGRVVLKLLKALAQWSYQLFMVTWFIFGVAIRHEDELPVRVHGQEAGSVLLLALEKAGNNFSLWFRHGSLAVVRCTDTWNIQETPRKASWSPFSTDQGQGVSLAQGICAWN